MKKKECKYDQDIKKSETKNCFNFARLPIFFNLNFSGNFFYKTYFFLSKSIQNCLNFKDQALKVIKSYFF